MAYLQQAGGPNRDADKKHVFIVRADGAVLSKEASTSFWGNTFKDEGINPGDTIVVPEKVYKGSSIRAFSNYRAALLVHRAGHSVLLGDPVGELMGSMYPPTYQSEIVPPQVEVQRGLDIFDVLFIFARRKWLLLTFALVGALSLFCWSLAQKKLYRADAVMMPPQEQQSSSALLGQLSALGALSGLGGGGAKSPSDLYIGLLESRTVAQKIVKDFDLTKAYNINSVPGAAGLLASRTKIASASDGLITVTVSDENPARAKDLANAYSNGLHALNTSLAIGQAAQRRLFFDQQLAEEKDKLADAEVALKEVEEKTGVIQLQGQTSVTISRISQLQADITSREVQLAALRSSSTDENPEVIRTESELAGLRKQLVAMRGKVGAEGNDDLGIPSSQVPGLSLEYIRKERDVQYHTTLLRTAGQTTGSSAHR